MKFFAYSIFAIALISGCKHGAAAASVAVGQTKEQVTTALGTGLVTATRNDQINGVYYERRVYRSGSDGVAVEFTNDKVTKVETRPDVVPGFAQKVSSGMTKEQVLQALGEPVGYNPRFNSQCWIYQDAVAPVRLLNVWFKDGKVDKVIQLDNSALPN